MKKVLRARQFMYVQDVRHLKVEESEIKTILKNSNASEWAYILHDKDTDENGELIQPHYHIILKFENPQSVTRIAQLFKDSTQYVDIWKGRINNAYSYLLHETDHANSKYHYNFNEVIASFDFKKRIEEIRKKNRFSAKEAEKYIRAYADNEITSDQLREKIGVLNFAKRKRIIDNITEILAYEKHQQFLKIFAGSKCQVFWLYGKSGVGKTRVAREVLQEQYPENFCVLGSARDHFQDYRGQNYIILNDLRPDDYNYGNLLTLLDPYEIDKMAPSRYHDKYLNAKEIVITTPYSPLDFYRQCTTVIDRKIDTFEQLERRITSIEVTVDNLDQVKAQLLQFNSLQNAIKKIKKSNPTSPDKD